MVGKRSALLVRNIAARMGATDSVLKWFDRLCNRFDSLAEVAKHLSSTSENARHLVKPLLLALAISREINKLIVLLKTEKNIRESTAVSIVGVAIAQKLKGGRHADQRDIKRIFQDIGASVAVQHLVNSGLVRHGLWGYSLDGHLYSICSKHLPPKSMLYYVWGRWAELDEKILNYMKRKKRARGEEIRKKFGEEAQDSLELLREQGFLVLTGRDTYELV